MTKSKSTKSANVKSKKPKKSPKRSKSKSTKSSKSSKSSSSKSGSTSASVIGASKGAPAKSGTNKGGKSMVGASYEASNVLGRPKLCKQMAKVIGTKGAISLKSTKEMKSRGYELGEKNLSGQEALRHAKGPKGKSMVCKLIELKQCTPRYKITMERYSLKIMRFIGKKPLAECFPKIYDIFLVSSLQTLKFKGRNRCTILI